MRPRSRRGRFFRTERGSEAKLTHRGGWQTSGISSGRNFSRYQRGQITPRVRYRSSKRSDDQYHGSRGNSLSGTIFRVALIRVSREISRQESAPSRPERGEREYNARIRGILQPTRTDWKRSKIVWRSREIIVGPGCDGISAVDQAGDRWKLSR